MEVPIDFVLRSASAADPDALRPYPVRRLAFALRRELEKTELSRRRRHSRRLDAPAQA